MFTKYDKNESEKPLQKLNIKNLNLIESRFTKAVLLTTF